jgi:AcrR family transcriptional regulator
MRASKAVARRPAHRAAPPPALTGTRARIIGAALELFAERGFAATTTLEIARRAQVAEKTLFSHFKTKEALFDETLTPATFELFIAEANPRHEELLDTPWERLDDFLVALLEDRIGLIQRHPSKFKLILQELLLRPERVVPFQRKFRVRIAPKIEAVFERLRKAGELRDVPSAVVLRMTASIMLGYSINRFVFNPGRRWNDAAEIRAMVDVLVRGLAPRARKR